MTKAQFRRLVVRVIEDVIIVCGICGCIFGTCAGFSLLFNALGVS